MEKIKHRIYELSKVVAGNYNSKYILLYKELYLCGSYGRNPIKQRNFILAEILDYDFFHMVMRLR